MSTRQFNCYSLFRVKDSTNIDNLLRDREKLMKNAFYGDSVLSTLITSLLHREASVGLTWEEVVSLRARYESDESLSRFLVEATDFSSLAPSHAAQSNQMTAIILKALFWESNPSTQKSLLSPGDWKDLGDQIVLWIQENILPQDLPKLLTPVPRRLISQDHHSEHHWDSLEPRNQHSGLDQVKTGLGWFGRRCLLCGAFLLHKRLGKKSWKEILLGPRQCPSSPPDRWLEDYRRALEEEEQQLALLEISRGQLIIWGFLDS